MSHLWEIVSLAQFMLRKLCKHLTTFKGAHSCYVFRRYCLPIAHAVDGVMTPRLMLGVDESTLDPSCVFSDICVNKVEIRYGFQMKEDSSAPRLVCVTTIWCTFAAVV